MCQLRVVGAEGRTSAQNRTPGQARVLGNEGPVEQPQAVLGLYLLPGAIRSIILTEVLLAGNNFTSIPPRGHISQ